jgi:hypothetical protein
LKGEVVGIEDVDEEVAMFYADHFICFCVSFEGESSIDVYAYFMVASMVFKTGGY